MPATGTRRIQMNGSAHHRTVSSRHRLGDPGLKHCRRLGPVRVRLVRREVTRHAAPVSPMRLGAEVAMVLAILTATGTVLVSGWYAAASAAVMAGIVTP
jgi:hypothetical protein